MAVLLSVNNSKTRKTSWIYPYQINNECIRIKKTCRPLQDGCAMEGKAAFADSPLNRVNENVTRKEKKKRMSGRQLKETREDKNESDCLQGYGRAFVCRQFNHEC